MSEWDGYILEDLAIDFPPGSTVLDVGCGEGVQMAAIAAQGCNVIGMDIDLASLGRCREKGLNVFKSVGEKTPIAAESLDGIICKVVLPYTDEEKVIAEFGRILKPGGTIILVSHGAGYYLSYAMRGDSLKTRFYGLRSLANTWFRILSGQRLPGFLGDTIYQSRSRLAKYVRSSVLELEKDLPSKEFLGFPVFIYQRVLRNGR